MTRLAMAILLGQSGHLALAAQSQIPLRVGDCVQATTQLEFFYKDEGEYERTHLIKPTEKGNSFGVLLNINSNWNEPSTVEFLNHETGDPVVSGAVFLHQFARTPWMKGRISTPTSTRCLSVKDLKDGYQPVIKMSQCESGSGESNKRWQQQFSFNHAQCGARPIRWTDDPSKCLDAVHPNKILLTDCSGVDSQKFLFKCHDSDCNILAMGGRKDMCLWWDETAEGDADLQIRSCNQATNSKFAQQVSDATMGLKRRETRDV